MAKTTFEFPEGTVEVEFIGGITIQAMHECRIVPSRGSFGTDIASFMGNNASLYCNDCGLQVEFKWDQSASASSEENMQKLIEQIAQPRPPIAKIVSRR